MNENQNSMIAEAQYIASNPDEFLVDEVVEEEVAFA
jgi:energy-coupling factor transporter ATP-binding protein EcfA2